jgi:hypothetical protein
MYDKVFFTVYLVADIKFDLKTGGQKGGRGDIFVFIQENKRLDENCAEIFHLDISCTK